MGPGEQGSVFLGTGLGSTFPRLQPGTGRNQKSVMWPEEDGVGGTRALWSRREPSFLGELHSG